MATDAYPQLVLMSGEGDTVLAPVPLASAERNEAWLRDFLLCHPTALPAAELDPAFADPIGVCSELRTGAGPIDALFVNRHGALVLVECKLFRNPQARREVVAQILDYAKELARWGYADLQAAVSQRLGRPGENALYRLAAGLHPNLDEAAFVDAVSRNLSRGRFLLLIVGDGIRQETEAIAEYVQDHAALRFTLGLIEMRGFALPDGKLIVQPRVLARTREVERVVFRFASAPAGLEEAAAEEATEVASVAAEQRSEALAKDRAFWTDYTRRLILDDPAQPIPTARGIGNARASLGHPDIWLTAYRSRGFKRIGVFIRLRGTVGHRVWEALRADASTIDAAIAAAVPSAPLTWHPWWENEGATTIEAVKSESFEPEGEAAERHLAWLLPMTNAFVNVFRPRIRSLLPD